MKHVSIAAIVAGFVLAAGSPALAQQATNAWGNSWDFRNPNERTADLNRAQLINQAENGGLTTVTNIAGDVIQNTTYEGTVNQATSTNVGNMSTTNVRAEGSNITLTVSTGQSTTNVNQGAGSDVDSNDPED